MSVVDDIAKVTEQEQRLVFRTFNEEAALDIGLRIRDLAKADGVALAIDIRFFNRPLFYFAMPGTNADNPDWLRRKGNCVRRWERSSYLTALRWKRDSRTIQPDHNVDPTEYAVHGGAFSIRVEGVGVVGSITASGLPQRQDHAYVVRAICQHMGIDPAELALGPEAP